MSHTHTHTHTHTDWRQQTVHPAVSIDTMSGDLRSGFVCPDGVTTDLVDDLSCEPAREKPDRE